MIALLMAAGSPASARDHVAGVPNFYRVDANIWRGAQPSEYGLQQLARLGVKTVLDLRRDHSVREKAEVTRFGMQYVEMALNAHIIPPPGEVVKALAILQDSSRWPVFIHCQSGDDRTGMIVACYRMAHYRWTPQKALDEARSDAGRRLTQPMERFILGFDPAGKKAQP